MVDVYKGSLAYNAGLLPGDYVTGVDNTEIQNADQLTRVVGGLVAGRTYQISFVRYGERTTLPVKIAVRNQDGLASQAGNLWPGMAVIDITDQNRQQVGVPQGVQGVVVAGLSDQNAPAAAAGIQQGDVISSINGTHVRNVLDFYKALNGVSKGTISLDVIRQGAEGTVTLTR